MLKKLRDLTDEQVLDALDELQMKIMDERYPPRLKLWALVTRCHQIDPENSGC